MDSVVALLAVPLCFALIFAMTRRLIVGAAVILGGAIYHAWVVELPGYEVGIMVYPPDAIALLVATAALMRMIISGRLTLPIPLQVFLGMLMFSFLSGLAMNGQKAGVDFRVTFSYVAGIAYCSSFRVDDERILSVFRLWIAASCCLMLVACFAWSADLAGLPIAKRWTEADPTGVKFRVLNSSMSYVIGVGMVMLMYLLMNRAIPRASWLVGLALGCTVMVLQHRSVWIATFVSATIVVLLSRRGRGTIAIVALSVAVTVAGLSPLIGSKLSSVTESVEKQAQRATDLTQGTFAGRLSAWQDLLSDWKSLSMPRQMIGKPFGSPYAGLQNAPHNCYLQVMYRTGYIGISAMLATYILLMVGLMKRHRGDGPVGYFGRTAMFALLAGQLVFFIPYAFTPPHGLLVGLAVAMLGKQGKKNAPYRMGASGSLLNEEKRSPSGSGPIAYT